LSGLLVSHLDVFERRTSLKWCEQYDTASRLPLGNLGDLSHQIRLTKLLETAQPQFSDEPIASAPNISLGLRVSPTCRLSFGPKETRVPKSRSENGPPGDCRFPVHLIMTRRAAALKTFCIPSGFLASGCPITAPQKVYGSSRLDPFSWAANCL